MIRYSSLQKKHLKKFLKAKKMRRSFIKKVFQLVRLFEEGKLIEMHFSGSVGKTFVTMFVFEDKFYIDINNNMFILKLKGGDN